MCSAIFTNYDPPHAGILVSNGITASFMLIRKMLVVAIRRGQHGICRNWNYQFRVLNTNDQRLPDATGNWFIRKSSEKVRVVDVRQAEFAATELAQFDLILKGRVFSAMEEPVNFIKILQS